MPSRSPACCCDLVLERTAARGARTAQFPGPFLAGLPIYGADGGPPAEDALELAATVARADAVIVASPGYHGAVSGLVKNGLDHLELLREDAAALPGRAGGRHRRVGGRMAGVRNGAGVAALHGARAPRLADAVRGRGQQRRSRSRCRRRFRCRGSPVRCRSWPTSSWTSSGGAGRPAEQRSGTARSAGRAEPQPAALDDEAAVLHVGQARVLGDPARLRRADAQLQPQRAGARRRPPAARCPAWQRRAGRRRRTRPAPGRRPASGRPARRGPCPASG